MSENSQNPSDRLNATGVARSVVASKLQLKYLGLKASMFFSQTAIRRAVVATVTTATVAAGAIAAMTANTAVNAQQKVTLNGAGATFPALLYQRYIREFQAKNPNIKVNYQGIGSGGGIRQTIAGTVHFGGSDAAMTDAQMSQGAAGKRGIILVPTAGGSVVPIYNLPGVSKLRLSRTVLPEIFGGRITKWNDPKIVKDNPGVNLPNSEIKTVVRADGSGTTFIFVNHLSAVSSYFRGRIGVSTAPEWTTDPLKGQGNPGVAALVKRTAGTVGYVEQSYADRNKLAIAEVQTAKKQWVMPSLALANQAVAAFKFPENFRVFDGDPDNGYPITGITWMMVYRQYPNAAQSAAIKKWMTYVLTDGQNINDDLEFTRIPAPVLQRALAQVNQIKP